MRGKTKAGQSSRDKLAWQDGYDSRHEGKAIGVNPYKRGGIQFTEWEAGYMHADTEIANASD